MKAIRLSHFLVPLAVLGAACTLMAQGPGGRGGFGFGGGRDLFNFTGKTITGAPFTASITSQSVETLSNGTSIQREETGQVARDSSGRVMVNTSTTRPNSSGGTQTVSSITIYDPVAGYIYRLNPQKMTGVQMPIRQRTASPRTVTRPTNPNVATLSLGTANRNGVNATGTQVTRTIPTGTIGNSQAIQSVRHTWVSSDLQIPVEITVTDPRSGNRSMDLTNIAQSEPDGSLFTVPSGYTITSGPGRGPGGQFRPR